MHGPIGLYTRSTSDVEQPKCFASVLVLQCVALAGFDTDLGSRNEALPRVRLMDRSCACPTLAEVPLAGLSFIGFDVGSLDRWQVVGTTDACRRIVSHR